MKRSIGRISFILLVIILLTGTLIPASGSAETVEKLYARHCLRCHGAVGDGKGPAHTNLRPRPRDFRKGNFKYRSTPIGTLPTVQDVEKIISKGILKTSMPPFESFLTQDEIRRLAAYVLKMAEASGMKRGRAVQINRPTESRLELILKGNTEYAKLGCAQCHGFDGRGLGPAAANTRDENGWWIQPTDLTDAMAYGGGAAPVEIFKHLKTGLGVSSMPHYGETVDDETLWKVAFYLESLQVSGEPRTLISEEKWDESLPAEVRGEYLVRSMSCGLCHTNYRRDGSYRPEFYLAGGVRFFVPGYGTLYMRNLTADKETGLGNWTHAQIVDSIKRGKAPDRQLDALGMPWPFFYSLRESDVEAIASYLQTLKPVKNKIPERKMQPFWKRIWHRLKQLAGLEYGRLEYWAGNAGTPE